MKVSVLVPIYRTRPEHLKEAIASVLAQTMTDFELLLLDDCPEDPREDVVRTFDDPRIVYRRNERNLGISASRNRLIEMARGEYLAVFDHDDVCRPDRLEKEAAYLDAHSDCGVVSGQVRRTGCGTVTAYPAEDRDIRVELMGRCVLWHPASMIRRSVLDAHGLRYEEDCSPAEDYMLWLRLAPHTRFHNLPDVLIDYRWHEGNTSKSQAERLEASARRVRCRGRVALPELWAEYEEGRTHVTRVRLFGLPLLKIVRTARETRVLLFDVLPVLKAVRN